MSLFPRCLPMQHTFNINHLSLSQLKKYQTKKRKCFSLLTLLQIKLSLVNLLMLGFKDDF